MRGLFKPNLATARRRAQHVRRNRRPQVENLESRLALAADLEIASFQQTGSEFDAIAYSWEEGGTELKVKKEIISDEQREAPNWSTLQASTTLRFQLSAANFDPARYFLQVDFDIFLAGVAYAEANFFTDAILFSVGNAVLEVFPSNDQSLPELPPEDFQNRSETVQISLDDIFDGGDSDDEFEIDVVYDDSDGINHWIGLPDPTMDHVLLRLTQFSIVDPNGSPCVSLAVDTDTMAEASGQTTVTASLSDTATEAVTVQLGFSGSATNGLDYLASTSEIVIPAGESHGTATITSLQDALDERDETIAIDITQVENANEDGAQRVTATIIDDDDPPQLALSVDNGMIAEADGEATVTARLSEASGLDVVAFLTISGSAAIGVDYAQVVNSVVIPAGRLSGSITVSATQDELIEGDETVVVAVAAVINAQADPGMQVTITIADDDDAPTTLVVQSFAPTSTGFVIDFSRDLNTAVLNLYSESPDGAADVTLTGALTGQVAGTLVTDDRTVIFVKSGAPLLADEYRVSLRSAPDGFSLADGEGTLDGDGDGIAGDDFHAIFSVEPQRQQAVIIHVPDLVRGPGQEVASLPLSLSDGRRVRTVALSIDYDPAVLNITGIAPGPDAPAGSEAQLQVDSAGSATITFSSPVDLPHGVQTFVTLTASIPEAAQGYGDSHVLDMHSTSIRDGRLAGIHSVEDDCVLVLSYFGDVSGNARINAADAAQVAQVAALLSASFPVSSRVDPGIIGDISGNGRVNAADASLVAQHAALFQVPQIPPIPAGLLPDSGNNDLRRSAIPVNRASTSDPIAASSTSGVPCQRQVKARSCDLSTRGSSYSGLPSDGSKREPRSTVIDHRLESPLLNLLTRRLFEDEL